MFPRSRYNLEYFQTPPPSTLSIPTKFTNYPRAQQSIHLPPPSFIWTFLHSVHSPHSPHSLSSFQRLLPFLSLVSPAAVMASSSSEHAAKPEETGGGETSEARPPPSLGTDQLLLYRGLKKAKKERGCTAKERISRMPPCTAGKRSSIYRGVTRYSNCRTCDVRLALLLVSRDSKYWSWLFLR